MSLMAREPQDSLDDHIAAIVRGGCFPGGPPPTAARKQRPSELRVAAASGSIKRLVSGPSTRAPVSDDETRRIRDAFGEHGGAIEATASLLRPNMDRFLWNKATATLTAVAMNPKFRGQVGAKGWARMVFGDLDTYNVGQRPQRPETGAKVVFTPTIQGFLLWSKM